MSVNIIGKSRIKTKKMRTEEITYKGILLEVTGEYTIAEEQIFDIPGSDASFQTYDVFVEGVNIVDLLGEDDLMEIDNLVLEKICG